jgi:small subunit ribosomal protein S7
MRKRRAEKRYIKSDPKYNDILVSKFINLDVFKKAVSNVSPLVEVRSRRVGGATYQVPMEVRHERRTALALRWIRNYSRDRKDKSMAQKLASELLAAANGEGSSVKKKDDTHRMAEANKAFAHFKW